MQGCEVKISFQVVEGSRKFCACVSCQTQDYYSTLFISVPFSSMYYYVFYVVSTIYIAVSLLYAVLIYSVLIEGIYNIGNSESLSFLLPYFKCDHPLLNLFLHSMSVEF